MSYIGKFLGALGLFFMLGTEVQAGCDVFKWKQADLQDNNWTCLVYNTGDLLEIDACSAMSAYRTGPCSKQYVLTDSPTNKALCETSNVFDPDEYQYAPNPSAKCTGDGTMCTSTPPGNQSTWIKLIYPSAVEYTKSIQCASDGTIESDCAFSYVCSCVPGHWCVPISTPYCSSPLTSFSDCAELNCGVGGSCPAAQKCKSNSDCSEPGLICSEGFCIRCKSNSDCSDGLICSQGFCIQPG